MQNQDNLAALAKRVSVGLLTAAMTVTAQAAGPAVPAQGSSLEASSGAVPAYVVQAPLELGVAGKWDYLNVENGSQRLFMSAGDHVNVIDLASGRISGSIDATPGVHGIAFATELGLGFTSNGKADSVTVFELATLKRVRDVAIGGHNPDAILYDKSSGYLLTFNGKSKDASLLDVGKMQLLGQIALGGKPEFAVSDGHGLVFVNIEDKAEIVVLNLAEQRVQARWPLARCEEPTGLAYDAGHQRLFSVCQNQTMVVLDAISGKAVERVMIGAHPDAVIYDAERALLLSSNGGQGGSLSVVRQLDADHYRSSQMTTRPGAKTMAFNPADKKVYLPYAQDGKLYLMVLAPAVQPTN